MPATNHFFYNTGITLPSFSFFKSTESVDFNGFIASSACVHKNMEHANDEDELLG